MHCSPTRDSDNLCGGGSADAATFPFPVLRRKKAGVSIGVPFTVLDHELIPVDALIALFHEHQLLLLLAGGSFLLPMRLPSRPPEGFESECRLREGDIAFEGECVIYSRFFPPGLFSRMFVKLHGLGSLRTYYASGGMLQDEAQSMTLVFMFDPKDFALKLRVHGARVIESELRAHLVKAADATKEVFAQFEGLGGRVPERFHELNADSTADLINAKVRRPLARDAWSIARNALPHSPVPPSHARPPPARPSPLLHFIARYFCRGDQGQSADSDRRRPQPGQFSQGRWAVERGEHGQCGA